MANNRPKKFTVVKNLYLEPMDLAFAEEYAWRQKYSSVSEYMRSLIREDMKKHPDVVECVSKRATMA